MDPTTDIDANLRGFSDPTLPKPSFSSSESTAANILLSTPTFTSKPIMSSVKTTDQTPQDDQHRHPQYIQPQMQYDDHHDIKEPLKHSPEDVQQQKQLQFKNDGPSPLYKNDPSPPDDDSPSSIDNPNPSSLDNSQSWLISPRALFYIRCALSVYVAAFVIWRASLAGIKYVYFFTNCSWIALLVYMVLATIASFGVVRDTAASNSLLRRILPWNLAITHTTVIMTSILFWVALSPMIAKETSIIERVSLINGHLGNILVVLIDLFLCKSTIHSAHMIAPALATLSYVPIVCIIHGMTGYPLPYETFAALIHDGVKENSVNALRVVLTAILGACCACGSFSILVVLTRVRDCIFGRRLRSKPAPIA